MEVLMADAIDSSLDEIIKDLSRFEPLSVLSLIGKILCHENLLSVKSDMHVRFSTLAPLAKLVIEHNGQGTEKINYDEIVVLCKKIISLDKIKKSNRNDAGELESCEEDAHDFLVRFAWSQERIDDTFYRTVARLFFFFNDMSEDWGKLDLSEKFKDTFGLSFNPLATMFFGVIALQTSDKNVFPGIRFSTYFTNVNEEVKQSLENIKNFIIKDASSTIQQLQEVSRQELYQYDPDGANLSTSISPLEEKPFINIDDDHFLLPVPEYLINRMADYLFIIINKIEVEQRELDGKSNKYLTEFSQKYGKIVESYIAKILSELNISYKKEPPYYNRANDAGPDLIIPDQRIIIEVSKLVPPKSLRTSISTLDVCYADTITKKFNQSFKWFLSHKGSFQNIFPSNAFFIVITAEVFPATHFSFGKKILDKLLEQRWHLCFPLKKLPKYLVLSISDFEILGAVVSNYNISMRSLLEEYLQYVKSEPDIITEKSVKMSFKNYFLLKYNLKFKDFPIIDRAYRKYEKESEQSFFAQAHIDEDDLIEKFKSIESI